ncbi:MAG: sulfurtransferase-like selenium metabolism protein YedF [Chloroflexota bacterium]
MIDARGLACPQPVILTRKAMETESDIVTVVDNVAAQENVSRMARSQGYEVSVEEKEGDFYLRLTRAGAEVQESAAEPCGTCDTGTVLLVTSDTLGRGDAELGRILIRSFFHSLNEVEPRPQKVVLINAGVKLAASGSEVLEDLRALAGKGVSVQACGTCLQFFGLTDALAVGEVTNMYSIVEALLGPGRVVTV